VELRILSQNLFLGGATCRELEQKFDAEASPARARLAAENLRVRDDQVFGYRSCVSIALPCDGTGQQQAFRKSVSRSALAPAAAGQDPVARSL
jgi:hypothetical protein